MNFKDNLNQIKDELSNHHRSRSLLMEQLITERLNLTFTTYESELQKTLDYLSRREELNLISKINRRSNGKSESN